MTTSQFRSVVSEIVETCAFLKPWVNPIKSEESMDIIHAIEQNKISLYVGEQASDEKLDAIHTLLAIYNELKNDEVDEEFVTQTLSDLASICRVTKRTVTRRVSYNFFVGHSHTEFDQRQFDERCDFSDY